MAAPPFPCALALVGTCVLLLLLEHPHGARAIELVVHLIAVVVGHEVLPRGLAVLGHPPRVELVVALPIHNHALPDDGPSILPSLSSGARRLVREVLPQVPAAIAALGGVVAKADVRLRRQSVQLATALWLGARIGHGGCHGCALQHSIGHLLGSWAGLARRWRLLLLRLG